MRCFISSCLLKGFQFCYSFLVCNLRRLCSERYFIVFFSIVIYLVVLSGCVLLGLFMWRHRELFFSWDHGGRQCWGVRKSDGILEHKIPEQTPESRNREGTRNPRKSILVSKVVNPFTRALEPPFIGRRRDFYIPRLPSNLENIPSVNTYMNVFYIPLFVGLISYIYKPATSSHFEHELLRWRLWLGLPSTIETWFMKITTRWDFRTEIPRASRISRVHEFLSLPDFSCPETNSRLAIQGQFGDYFTWC
jgi:hypothetical protein